MAEHRNNSGNRPPGRPASIDPDRIAASALQLFVKQGYESTSMEDIARAAGIGRKSLYRYFPSKAALVWGGMDPVLGVLADGLRQPSGGFRGPGSRRTEDELHAGLREAVSAAARTLPDLSVTRGRLRLISSHTELAADGFRNLAEHSTALANYLEEGGLPARRAALAAAALHSALVVAWMQWAESEDPDPLPYVADAVNVVRLAPGG